MLVCRYKSCARLYYEILDCLNKRQNWETMFLLEKLKNHCELVDTSGLTLLHYSINYGNTEMTEHLIDRGYSVNARDYSGTTPLMLTIKAKDHVTVKILMENNADIYITDSYGKNSLELAFISRFYSSPLVPLKQNSQLVLDMLIEKINDDFSNGRLIQFFSGVNDFVKFTVVVFGSVEATEFILKNGYPSDIRESKYGRTALHYAIMVSRFRNAKILIEHGANVNALDDYDNSPLRYYASDFEDVDENAEVLTSLLRYSTDLSTPDPNSGLTDVERLIMSGKEKTVRAIFESVINIDACLDEGSSLLHRLVANKNLSNLDFLDELNYTKFDINKSIANKNISNNDLWDELKHTKFDQRSNHTALMKAVYDGCPEKVEFLLKRGACVNVMDSNGDPVLYSKLLNSTGSVTGISERTRNVAKIIELLLQYGFNIELFYRDSSYLLNWFSPCTKVIAAHLALLWTLDNSSLSELSRGIMDSKSDELKNYFDLCVELLKEMKLFKLYDTVTLFELLVDEQGKFIALYARNWEFILSFISEIENLSRSATYYVNILRRRLAKLLDEARLQKFRQPLKH